MSAVPTIEIELDRKRNLKLTFGALSRAELQLSKLRGGERVNLIQMLNGLPSFLEMQAILWAGLLHEDPKLEFDAVGEMLAVTDFISVLTKVQEAAREQSPKNEQHVNGEDQSPPLQPTGSSSGASGASS